MGIWQDIVALLIVAVVAVWLVCRIVRLWRPGDSLGGCSVGCHGCTSDAGNGSMQRSSAKSATSPCHASPRDQVVQLTLPAPDEARNR